MVEMVETTKKTYEKPTIVKLKTMYFAEETLYAITGRYICKQCSSCHGCR